MNRIVREHYPVSKLPEDLREGFGPNDEVRVVIDAPEAADRVPTPKPGLFSAYRHLVRSRFDSDKDMNDHLRELREEWDHRDR